MANLTATDWAVTAVDEWIKSGKRHVLGKLTLADTAKTYVNDGVPLPVIGKLGLQRQIDSFTIVGADNARVPVPGTPVAALVSDATAGQVPAADHTYKCTFVITATGRSRASLASNSVTNDGTHTQNTVSRPTGFDSRITHWNVYRDEAAAGTWKLVNASPITIATASYADIIPNAALGADVSASPDSSLADYVFQYDKTNHKLFFFVEEAVAAGGPMLEANASEVPGPRVYTYLAVGW